MIKKEMRGFTHDEARIYEEALDNMFTPVVCESCEKLKQDKAELIELAHKLFDVAWLNLIEQDKKEIRQILQEVQGE